MTEPAHTLVIDTSFGSAVGIVGDDPIIETDSRTHVERLQNNIARAVAQAGLQPQDVERVVVGVGPAPFTGLRAGIVAAKTIAFATGAQLIGQDILMPQHAMMRAAHAGAQTLAEYETFRNLKPIDSTDIRLTLAVNDARRRQLYFAVYADDTETPDGIRTIEAMDIDYPQHIAERVSDIISAMRQKNPEQRVVLDIVGHGALAYQTAWEGLDNVELVAETTLFDLGMEGLRLFASLAETQTAAAPGNPIEPLYLRRPDVSVPKPLKQVLHHSGAERTA